jgi:anti-anti-sigma regulatory factor
MQSQVIDPAQDRMIPGQAECPVPSNGPRKLTGELSMGTASDLRSALLDCLSRGLTVDLSEVQECDTAALQLIYSFGETAARHKPPFKIAGISTAIREAAAALGVEIEAFVA